MKLKEFKKKVAKPLRQATLCFLIKDDEILLAMKKRGFGEGRWNGVGGKPDLGESIEGAAVRETKEEIGVVPLNIQKKAILNFYFPHEPLEKNWNQQVVVYFATKWEGEPSETEEMKPGWFSKGQLPFEKMWDDDKLWLPKVLAGEYIEADFAFDKDQKIAEHKIINKAF